MTSTEVVPRIDLFAFELDKLYVIPIFFLSFAVGIPLNGYIIRRLYVKGVKGSYYYKLLMLMSVTDVYIAFFYVVEYYNTGTYHGGTIQTNVLTILNTIQTFFTLIVVVYWKTVIKKKPKYDKILYSVAAAHFIQLLVIVLLALVEYCLMPNNYYHTLILIEGCTIAVTATITFLATSFVCIYSLVIVLLTETDSYSAQTLRAYKRMAIAHFAQCIIVEIDIIAQNFTLAFLFLVVTSTSVFYSDTGEINYERMPGWMRSLLNFNLVFITLNYLVPVIKPFIRSVFIAWALRRLLSTEQNEVIRTQPTPRIQRSTTRDN